MLTKTDLQAIDNLIRSRTNPLQDSQDDIKETFENKLTEFKSDILDAVDAVMGELRGSREEQTVMSGQLSGYSDKLENHEERIGKLEKKVVALA